MMNRRLIAAMLASSLLLLVFLHTIQIKQFHETLEEIYVIQQGVFPYHVRQDRNASYVLLLGDMNGMNPEAREVLEEHVAQGYKGDSSEGEIVIPTVMPDKRITDEIAADDFFYLITNPRGVVIAHNFCSEEWAQEKKLYEGSAVSQGPYCGSERESERLEMIIREYGIRRVILYYDVESYKGFMDPFVSYLRERGIEHEWQKAR
jgi:hypothetical protein